MVVGLPEEHGHGDEEFDDLGGEDDGRGRVAQLDGDDTPRVADSEGVARPEERHRYDHIRLEEKIRFS